MEEDAESGKERERARGGGGEVASASDGASVYVRVASSIITSKRICMVMYKIELYRHLGEQANVADVRYVWLLCRVHAKIHAEYDSCVLRLLCGGSIDRRSWGRNFLRIGNQFSI